jgi:hypothetical protein
MLGFHNIGFGACYFVAKPMIEFSLPVPYICYEEFMGRQALDTLLISEAVLDSSDAVDDGPYTNEPVPKCIWVEGFIGLRSKSNKPSSFDSIRSVWWR